LNTAYTITIDHEESLEWIEQMTRGEDNLEFELQEFVEGVEVSTEGWFDGQTFVDGSLNSTFEEKRFMDGNVGPRVGCAGNVVWFWRDDNALTRMVRSLEKPLRELKYGPGPIDVNTIVNEDGIFFLEFTARFGYDALQAQLELYDAPVGEILYDLAHGELDTFPVSTDLVAIAVRLTIPPYPTDTEAARKDIPIFFRQRDLPHLHFNDVWLKDDQLVTAGVGGSIGVASFAARSVDLAREGVYDIIDRVKVASDDLQYRKEIGLRYHADFPSLMALIQPDAHT
jgi:phosphoribosylamine--glycine ligase